MPRMFRRFEAERRIKPVRVVRRQHNSPGLFDIGMGQDFGDHHFCHAAAAMAGRHENVSQIGKGGAVRDDARKSHLLFSRKRAKTKRIPN